MLTPLAIWRPLLAVAAASPALPAPAGAPDVPPGRPIAARIVLLAPGDAQPRRVVLRARAAQVVVRARAPRCGPVPRLQVAVDGHPVARGTIARRHATRLTAH